MGPKLEIGLLVARLKEIDNCLKKDDFKKARWFLHDLQLSLAIIDKCLENWQKHMEGKKIAQVV